MVEVSVAFYEWPMHLSVLVGGEEYCNLTEMFAVDDYHELACGELIMSHSLVEVISARSRSHGPFRCERHVLSEDWASLFACIPDR